MYSFTSSGHTNVTQNASIGIFTGTLVTGTRSSRTTSLVECLGERGLSIHLSGAYSSLQVKYHQRGLLAGIKQARHRLHWHCSNPEKREGPWGEDDVAVWMADKTAEGTASRWQRGRVMHHLGKIDTAEVLGEVMGRSLTYTRCQGRLNIRPIKEVTMVEVARRYRIKRDAHRGRTRRIPGRRSGQRLTCDGLQRCGICPSRCRCVGGCSRSRFYTIITSMVAT